MDESQPKAASSKQMKFGDEDYISYTDTHDLINEFYLKKSAWGLENYFLYIEEWLSTPVTNKEENTPLVICGSKGMGKKSLIVKWMEFHKNNSKKKFHDIILYHFATGGGINSNYFYAIYRLLNKLREKLDVSQKVELLEEKLRKYFGYWLEICDRIIQEQIVNDQNIILVFEGVDKFYDIDGGNKESKLAFWLPRNLPPRVKVIVTCETNSNSYRYFKKMNAKIIDLVIDQSLIVNTIEKHSNRELFVSEEIKQKHLQILDSYPEEIKNNFFFVKVFLSTFIPYPTKDIISKSDLTSDIWEHMYDDLDYEALKKIHSLDDLIILVLEFYMKKIMPEQYYKDLLFIFCLCQKGLYQDEILALVPIKPEEVKLFTAIFKEFLISQRKLWYLPSDYLKRLIQTRIPKDPQTASELHEKIANTLEKSSVSIRKLEEQTYHLYKSKSYFKLKETVSIIENFLLLFNPSTKYDLCRYWQTLEENGFDPSIEYNKAIEGFEMHYHPSAEDIFRIILQVSRFLKEFSDFETHYTPEFRHPPIVGGKELDEIGLMEEIQRLTLYFDMDPRKPPPKILDEIEQLNIEIPSNKEEVRKYHMNKLEALLNELNDVKAPKIENEDDLKRELEKDAELEKDSGLSDDSSKSEENDKNLEKKMAKNHQIQIKEYPDFRKQAISTDREPTYYYYKRWLWMIFPWACLSESLNYSFQIKKCFTSATKYMSVISEKKFTQRALKIAIEAKLKKKMLYAKKDEMDSQLASLKNMNKQIRKLDRQPSTLMIGHTYGQIFDNVPPIQHSSIQSQSTLEKKPSMPNDTRKVKSKKTTVDESNVFITSAITDSSRVDISKNQSLPHISTSRIDQEMTLNTSKILNRSKAQKERFRYFEPESHFLSGNERSSVTTLPRLKDSINNHTEKELNIMELQTNNLKRELDHLSYMNKSLSNTLKEMKMIEFNQNTFTKDEENKMELITRIKTLEQRIGQMENSYSQTKVLKIRCQKIINICKRNSHQNKEWIRSLNYLLQNYKKLIKFEQEQIKATREDTFMLNKIYNAYVEACNEKSSNHSILLKEMTKGLAIKNEFDEKFSKSDEVIEASAIEAVEKMKQDALGKEEIKNQQKMLTINEKTNKNLSSRLEELEESSNKLKEVLNVQNFDFENSEKFKDFRRAREKKNELNGAIMEREDRILQLKQILESKKTYLETLKKAQAHNTKSMSNSQIKVENINEKDESKMLYQNKLRDVTKEIDFNTQEAVKAKQSLLDSTMIVNSMCLKLGLDNSYTNVADIKWIKIKEKLEEKVEELKKCLSEEEIKKVDNGTFDYTKIYKQILPFDPSILNSENFE